MHKVFNLDNINIPYISIYLLYHVRGGSRNFKTLGGVGRRVVFLHLRFALTPLYIYPMFLLEE